MSETETAFADADVDLPDAAPAARGDQQPADNSGDAFGKRANKRINNLLGRAKSAEDRMAHFERENAELRRASLQHGQARLTSDEARVKSEIEAAQRSVRQARDSGDTDAEMTAHGRLTTLTVDAGNIARDKAQIDQAVARVPEAPSAPAAMTSSMQAWSDQNEWFRSDESMTHAAMAFDRGARAKGLVPESPEYFAFIDHKMRASFAEYFEDDAPQVENDEPVRQAAPVTSAAPRRNTPGAPASGRVIRLTAEQRDIAKAMGLSDQQYAAAAATRSKDGTRL